MFTAYPWLSGLKADTHSSRCFLRGLRFTRKMRTKHKARICGVVLLRVFEAPPELLRFPLADESCPRRRSPRLVPPARRGSAVRCRGKAGPRLAPASARDL